MPSLASQQLRWSPHRHPGARLLLHCHHLPPSHTLHRHMAPDYRIIKRNLTGASSGATGPPRQGRNNTLQSFMSTACQIHVSGSLQTKPIPSVAKHLFITVAYIDSVLGPTQALLLQNGTFDSVADIDCTVDRVANPSTHIFWMPGDATLLNLRKYAMSNGRLTLVMPTETILHIHPTIAHISLEFAMMRVRDTHPAPRSNEGSYSSTLNL